MTRLLAALLLVALTLSGQETDKSSVFDAVVTDTNGRAVTGMTAADFVVSAGGEPRTISGVTPLGDAPHSFVIVVDDLCLPSDALSQARSRMHRLVELLRPADRMAILRTSGGTGRERRLTAEREHLQANIEGTQFTGGSIGRNSCAAAAWSVVTQVLHGLASVDGRKSLLLLSGDLTEPSGNAAAELERLAAVSTTALYTSSSARSTLAGLTGGAMSAAVEQVVEESRGAYLITVPGPVAAANVMHRRAGVVVRFRRLTVTPGRGSGFLFQRPGTETLTDSINTPFADQIAVRVTPLYSHTRERGGGIEVMVHVEARDLGFLRDISGQYHLELDVALGAASTGGRVISPVTSEHVMDLNEVEYARALEGGIVVTALFSAGVIGPRELSAAVVDRRSGRAGSAGAFLEVPNLGRAQCVLSGLAVESGAQVRQSPAVRQFAPGDKLTFTYFVYNSVSDAQGRGSVETQVRLFASGREVLTGSVIPLQFEPSIDPVHRRVKGTIALAPQMAPGRYILQVTVTDAMAEQPRPVGQFIDFEVVAAR